MPADTLNAAAAGGISELAQYGVAGILAIVMIVGGAWLIRYFADQVKACHESTKGVVEKNTEAFQGVQLALVKLEAKLDR